MQDTPRQISRRDVLAGGTAVAASLALVGPPPAALAEEGAASSRSAAFEVALRKLVGEAKAEEGKVRLELPEFAENGNTVPYKLEVDSPMTDADHIRKLHLLSTGNPQPNVATFHFTPLSARAAVSGRMRLARSQDVVALAETSAGTFLIGSLPVKVTIGGCGNE